MGDQEQQAAEAPVEAPGEIRPEEPAPAPMGFRQRLMAKKINMILIGAVVAIVVIAAAVMAGGGAGGGGFFAKKAAPAAVKMTSMSGTSAIAGPQVPAGQSQEFPISFNSSDNSSEVTNIYDVKVACSWTDDYAGSEPDSMTFELTSPDGQNANQTTTGTSGNCMLEIKVSNITDSKMEDNTKNWVLKVTCDYAGHKDVGPFGFLIYTDAGNDFDAKVDFSYYGHEAKK